MRIAFKIAGILSLLLWCTASQAQNISNKGKDFWVGYGHHQFMENGSNTQQMTIYLSAESQAATVTVTIDSSGLLPASWWRRTYNIPANTVISIETATAATYTATAGAVGAIPKGLAGQYDARLFTDPPPAGTGGAGLFRKRGIHIESTVPIVAYAHIYGTTSSGASMLLPVEAWGYSYISLNSNQSYANNCYNWTYVIAKENNTIVEITPSVKTRAQNITGLQPGVPTQVTLQKGQIYQLIGANNAADANGNGGGSSDGLNLTGTVIKSVNCKAIAVFAGSSRTANPISCGSGGGDNDNQQLFPEHSWGKKYLTAPFSNVPATSFSTSMYRVAVKDPTTVVKRNGTQLAGLQNGNYYVFESNTADFIEADKPVTIAQYMTGGSCLGGSNGDPEMIILSPLEQATKQTGFYRNNDESIVTNLVTLIVPNRGTGLSSLRIDGTASFTHTYPHPQNPNYTVVIKSWPSAKAQCLVRSDSAFTGITYGLGGAESYGYNIGAQLNDLRALKNIKNQYDSVSTSNTFTCKNTPFKLSALISFQPTKIIWKLDTLGLPITPNARITQNNPVPVSTQVINGETYYLYELGDYKFTQSGTFYIPIETEEPSAVCSRKDQMYLEIIVKDPPKADFSFTQTGCQSNVFNFSSPTADGTGFTIKNWWWDFGDTGRDSTKQNPSHTYSADGTYNVHLSVVSQEGCIGDTTKAVTLTNVAVGASIVATPPNICQGGTITFTDTTTVNTAGITSWYWDFGNGQTVTLTANTPQTATYNTPGTFVVKHVANKANSGSCGADTVSKTITVSAKPAKPVVSNPVTYCQNATAVALTATALTGHTLTWYNNSGLTGGTATAPTPLTTTAGTTYYYVTQTSAATCVSDTARIEVIITPSIIGNTIGTSQTVCSGSPAATLTSAAVTGGTGTYGYQWQQSTDGGTTWTNITGATLATYSPGTLSTGITKFRRVITSGLCSDTSNAVDITVETNLGNYNITGSQTICQGTAPALLDGQTPTGGSGTYTFQWQGSTDGITWTVISGATLEDYQPGTLTVKTFFRRITTGGNCPAISNAVVINLNPTANGGITAPAAICQYNTGTVSFTATAGTAPFTVQLLVTSPSGGTTTITQSVANNSPATIAVIPVNSAPGNYTVALQSISDNGNCVRTAGLNSVTIGVTATPSLVFNPVTPVICAGGSITLNVSGAATYLWSPATGLSTTTGTTVTANPAATTTYTVTGTIAGCNGDGTITVTVNNRPAKPVVANQVVTYCQAAAATALSATALTGHTLTWYNNSGLTGGSTTAPTPSTATAGTVYYYVTQANTTTTCVSDTSRIEVTVTPSIGGNTVSATQTVCSGSPAATLTGGTVSGGTGTYAYQWQQSTNGGTTWTNITGATLVTYDPGTLATGVFQFRRIVTSGLCSSTSNAVTITVETNLNNYNILANQTICEGATPALLDGQTPTGGTGTYSYVWQTSTNGTTWTTITGATGEDYQPLALTANTYFRRITSGGNCPATSNSVLITVNPTPNGSITATTGICSYDAASVSFTATAGTAPYTVVLTITAPGGGTSTITQSIATNGPATINVIPINSTAGTYTIQLTSITDSKTCPKTTGLNSVSIVVTAKPNVTINGGAAPICEGSSTPLVASGATTYVWSPSTGLSATNTASITANPTATTAYQVIGTTNGCMDTADVTVTVVARPAKPVVTRPVSYCMGATATPLSATASAGNTLTWYNNAALTGGSSTAPTPLTGTDGTVNYYVTQTNSNNCVSDTSIIQVITRPLPTAAFTMPAGVCMPNGVAAFTNQSAITDGSALTYAWNFGDAASGASNTSIQKDPSHVFSASGNYTVTLTVTSAYGCVKTTSQQFNAFYEKPVAAFDVNPAALCQGQDNFFTDLSNPSGSTITKWWWSFGDGKTDNVKNPIHRYTSPGAYTVKLVVTTAIGCVSDTLPQPVTVYLQPRIDAGPSFVVTEGTTVQFKATANDTTGITLLWSPATGLSNAGWLQPTLTVRQNQTYTLTAIGAGNCTARDTMTVRILKLIEVPNVFSPNGDGTNDRWLIPNLADYPGAKVEIFNRWGQQVFLSYGYNKPWDGTHLNKALPLATYYYIITLNNGFKPVTGSVTIIK